MFHVKDKKFSIPIKERCNSISFFIFIRNQYELKKTKNINKIKNYFIRLWNALWASTDLDEKAEAA